MNISGILQVRYSFQIVERLHSLSTGNPQEVLGYIKERHKLEPTGEPSLQNAIEMARASMR